MAVVIDPDNLTQGASTAVSDMAGGAPTGQVVAFTSAGSNFPALTANMYFEIREHSQSEYNGLWQESGGSPTTAAVTATKVDGITLPGGSTGAEAVTWLGDSGAAANEKSIFFDTAAFRIRVLEQGNVSTDGVLFQAAYSFAKEEWKADNFLNPFDFPFVAVTPEQFEMIDDWRFYDDTTRKLMRTGGWREIDASDVLLAEYAGVITLGTFEAGADTAYYQVGSDPTDTGAATNFTFSGPVNEAILTYELNVGPDVGTGFEFANTSPDTIIRNDAGSWITDGYRVGGQVTVIDATVSANDGTYAISAVTTGTLTVTAIGGGDAGLTADTGDNTARFARNYRNAVKVFLRVRDGDPNGKTFAQAELTDIGVTAVDNKVFRFPISNATDLDISETDANIGSNTPYTQILVRYFDQAFSRDVDTPATPRDFGIVVDVGTFSGVDGATSGAGSALTTAEAGIPSSTYDGGTLTIHEGVDAGVYTITTATGGTVNISSTFPTGASNSSFTLQRSTPIVATKNEIYEKVQYLLRQAADVDSTDQIVTGNTADELLGFVGPTLNVGAGIPTNPNGGGSGVIIEGFDTNDTNSLVFTDNGGTPRTYPFVAAGTISWNLNLQNDANGMFWMYYQYTERFTNAGFSISAPTGPLATINSSTTSLVAELASGDYIQLSGFANAENNGIWVLTAAPGGTGPWTVTARKVNGDTAVVEGAGPTVSLDKNPSGSPDAILVDNNSGADITGSTFGSGSTSFDYDYDNNVQGGRTSATDAQILLKAIGFDTGQYVEVTGTITRTTGLTFVITSALERNYSNP